MSRMTVSINKINKLLDGISGLGGYAEDLVEGVLEPVVCLVVNYIENNLVNHQLTLEELCVRSGQPVWVEPLKEEKNYSDVTGYGVVDTEFDKVVRMPGTECFWWAFEDYGKTWIAYDSKPFDYDKGGDGENEKENKEEN